ncbi:MAG: hypothetical protein QOF48_2048, partial [Verrucomicrobiota bacterium]
MSDEIRHPVSFRGASLQTKQTVVVMLTAGVALMLACAGFVLFEVLTFREAMVKNLSTLADIIANNNVAAVQFGERKSAAENLSVLHGESNIEGVWILDAKSAVFADYRRPGKTRLILPPPLDGVDHQFTGDRLMLQKPIHHQGNLIGYVYIESNLDALRARLSQYGLIAAVVLLLAMLVAFLISLRLQR